MASKFTIVVTVILLVGEGAVTEMGATPNLEEICGKNRFVDGIRHQSITTYHVKSCDSPMTMAAITPAESPETYKNT